MALRKQNTHKRASNEYNTTKHCSHCGLDKDLSEFHRRTYRSGTVGYQPKCKSCDRKSKRDYYKPNERTRRQLKISEEKYNDLMKAQVCEICGADFDGKKCIDHCHKTEKIRGVLCNKCNTALGLVGDNLETLSRMIDYLNR